MNSRLKFILLLSVLLTACTAAPPKNSDNLCSVFREKEEWYDAARDSYQQWGLPVAVQMAIMHQESRFVADAQPPRPWLLGIIPWFRSSSAYGYAQAQDETWEDYSEQSDRWSPDRDDFADSCDFIGWYCAVSRKKLGIQPWDVRNLYLAYHEGHGGYSRKSYTGKRWLMGTAGKVAAKAQQYQQQLSSCQEELESKKWFFW